MALGRHHGDFAAGNCDGLLALVSSEPELVDVR